MVTIKSRDQIETMKEGGRILGAVLNFLKTKVRPGTATQELDVLSYEMIKGAGAKPAFLNYRPSGSKRAYPATLCASVNDVVVHGPPSDYRLKKGDLLKLDLGLRYQGLYLDSAITVSVGDPSSLGEKLIRVTREALDLAIEECRPGKTLGDIGYAVESHAHKHKFSIIKSLTGHGIGKNLHEDPNVFNFGRRGEGEVIEEGMVLAIEPMLSASPSKEGTKIRHLSDDSFATADGSLSAHFEHTVAVLKRGPLVLTKI